MGGRGEKDFGSSYHLGGWAGQPTYLLLLLHTTQLHLSSPVACFLERRFLVSLCSAAHVYRALIGNSANSARSFNQPSGRLTQPIPHLVGPLCCYLGCSGGGRGRSVGRTTVGRTNGRRRPTDFLARFPALRTAEKRCALSVSPLLLSHTQHLRLSSPLSLSLSLSLSPSLPLSLSLSCHARQQPERD